MTCSGCAHYPIQCSFDDQVSGCWITELQSLWREQLSLSQQPYFCHRYARSLGRQVFDRPSPPDNPPLADSCLARGVTTCSQCAPGTTTYAFFGKSYQGHCNRYYIDLSETPVASEGVYCLGKRGEVNLCKAGEFIAVSHVRAHGWEGSREMGICSRVVDLLQTIATVDFGVEWFWLDSAMLSSNSDMKLESKDFEWLYRNAKAVLVCDRGLAEWEFSDPVEQANALLTSEWNSRIWTLWEALSNPELWVLHKNLRVWSVRALLLELLSTSRNCLETAWMVYKPIRELSLLLKPEGPDTAETSQDRKLRTLLRVVQAGRGRRAYKPLHLFKSLFSLFDLEWPPLIKSYQKVHEIFLDNLGSVGFQSIALFAPFGIPGRYPWAPLSFYCTAGNLLSDVEIVHLDGANEMTSRTRTLASRWIGWKVRFISNVVSTIKWTEQLPTDANVDSSRPMPVALASEDGSSFCANAFVCPSFSSEHANQDHAASFWLLRPVSAEVEYPAEHYVIGRDIDVVKDQKGDSMRVVSKVAVVQIQPPLTNDSKLDQGHEIWVAWEGIHYNKLDG